MEKAYSPNQFEDEIYAAWEKSGYFNPDHLPGDRSEPFAVMMPPPNVTGVLHLGHALENAIMDIEVRYQRMQGKRALLLPGTDHAAVATQARVEKNLRAAGMKNPRAELGREELVNRIRTFAEESKATILSQVRKLGTSADWSRLAYTFDEPRSRAVFELFKRMYEDGLVYRGYRVVNWSVKGQSTCSDDELVTVERPSKLYTFKYAADFPIPIASTRPETKVGDTAVAVHPKGKWKQYIGQVFTVDVGAAAPLTIHIIGDEAIDEAFGTGALGVTPAHAAVDYDMYQRNKQIGIIPVIGKDGRMLPAAGAAYEGLMVEEAREKFVDWLREQGLMISEEDTVQNVGTSDRFGDVVEALPMEQWFVDVNKEIPSRGGKSLKDLMKEAVTTGHNGDPMQKVNITPDRFQNIYLQWIDNLRDWCISRQIWWGHRIPVWYRGEEMVVSETQPSGEGWAQDEDTLDTWFSSQTWTYSTLGWPEQTADFKAYHPTAWMQMGHEILFFWMARMILSSTYALDQIPFRDVYIHGILRDKEGRKFSKSLGNGIDPLDVIAKYGTDALRWSLIKGITPGNDARFYEEKVEDARNFVNKLWNVARYVLTKEASAQPSELSVADQWIQSRTAQVVAEMTTDLNAYNFSAAAEKLYSFVWNDFAAWYVEIEKFQPNPELVRETLETILKLAHPFIPFVTEAIWKEMNQSDVLMVAQWPQAKTQVTADIERQFADIQDIVTQLRDVRARYKISYQQPMTVSAMRVAEEGKEMIERLARVTIDTAAPQGTKRMMNASYELTLDLGAFVDVDAEKKKLQDEITQLEKQISGFENKLANKKYVEGAPEAIVQETRDKLAEAKAKLDTKRKEVDDLQQK